MHRIAQLRTYRPGVENLELRRLLAVDAAPFVPRQDFLFESSTAVQVDRGTTEEIVVRLLKDQWVSLTFEDRPFPLNSVRVEVESPTGGRVPLEAFLVGDDVQFETVPVDTSGEYRFVIENGSDVELNLSAVLTLNEVFEAESAQQTNNTLSTAFDLDPYFVTVSEELHASLVNVRGAFELTSQQAILEASFDAGPLSDQWIVESSYESGRVEIVDGANGSRLRMDATTPDPNNVASIDGVVLYDPETGQISLDASRPFTGFTIISRTGIFGGERPAFLDGPFDVFRADKLFRLDNRGVLKLDFGFVAPAGLSAEFLRDDIFFQTALLGGGSGSVIGSWELGGLDRGGPVTNSITTRVEGSRLGDSVLRLTYQSGGAVEGETIPTSFSGTAGGQFVAISDDGQRWRTVRLPATGDEPEVFELDLLPFARSRGMDLHTQLYFRIQQSTLGSPMFIDDIRVTSEPRVDWYRFTASGGDFVSIDGEFSPGEFQVYQSNGTPFTTSQSFRVPAEHDLATDFYIAVLGHSSPYGFSVRRNLASRNDEESGLQSAGKLNVIRQFEQTGYLGDVEYDIEFENGPSPTSLTIHAFALDADPATANVPLRVGSYSQYVENADGGITITDPGGEPSIVVPEADGHVLLSYDIGIPTAAQRLFVEYPTPQSDRSSSITIRFDEAVWKRDIDASDFEWTGPAIVDARMVDHETLELQFDAPLGAANHTLTIPPGYFDRLVSDYQDPPLSVTVDTQPIEILESSIQSGDVVPAGPMRFSVRYSESPFGLPRLWSESDQQYVQMRDSDWLPTSTVGSDGTITVTYTLRIERAGSYSLRFTRVRDEAGNGADGRIEFSIDEGLPRNIDHFWKTGHASFTRSSLRPKLRGEIPGVYLQTLQAGEALVGEFRGSAEQVREVRLVSPSGVVQSLVNRDSSNKFGFEFQALEEGVHRIELLGNANADVTLYLARDVVRLVDSIPLNNQPETAVDLTPLLESHPASIGDNAYVVDILKQQHEEDTEWYSVTVQPGETLAVSASRLQGSGGSPWFSVYRDGELIDTNPAARYQSPPHPQPATYSFRILDDHDLYTLTLAKNMSLASGDSYNEATGSLPEPLPETWRYAYDAQNPTPQVRSFSAFLEAGEQLDIEAFVDRAANGSTQLSIIDPDFHVLAVTTVDAKSTSLNYTATASGYVVVQLKQLTGTSRLTLGSRIVPARQLDAIQGDLDRNGVIDQDDVRLLERAATERLHLAALDFTNDARVDEKDMLELVEKSGTVVGDLNFDGRFDQHDLAIAGLHLEQPWLPVTWFDGDVNLNGQVDSDDLITMFQRGGFTP